MSAIPTRRPGRGHPPHAIPPGDPHCPPQPLHRTLSSLPAHATCRSRAGSPCAPRAAPVQPVTARAARRPPHTPLAVAPRSPRRRAGSTPPPPPSPSYCCTVLAVLSMDRAINPRGPRIPPPAASYSFEQTTHICFATLVASFSKHTFCNTLTTLRVPIPTAWAAAGGVS